MQTESKSLRVHIDAKPSSSVLSDIQVTGELIESDGAVMTVMGDDGLTHRVIQHNGKQLLESGDGSRTRVRGVVENVEIQ
ncbi:MAG: hypothetical protein HQRvContig01_64 [Haloquadratum phage sp.]|nr:MAG: hypothetical protein HQRvContig01_64 [Haloquadratum phage sp.]